MYEVEMKFAVTDPVGFESRLRSHGAIFRDAVSQLDRYFNHPCRDFAVTDEAVRLRRVGGAVELTYKGPRIDEATKTRRECSLPLPSAESSSAATATVEAWTEVLAALGFRPVAEVAKERRTLLLDWQGHRVEVAIDAVRDVGSFVELEMLAEESGVGSARESLIGLARSLGLEASERRSYLELLLAARTAANGGGR